MPEGSLASTVTVKSLVSSLVPQSLSCGLPPIFLVVGSYVRPLGRSFTLRFAFGLSVVTGISAIGFPYIIVLSSIGLITVGGTELASFGFEPFALSSTSV